MSAPENTAPGDTALRQAVLFAVEETSQLGSITDHTPAFLLPLAGKCLADRIAGRLSDLGIEELIIIINKGADAAAHFLETGIRWGVTIRLLDIPRPSSAVERLKSLNLENRFLLGDLFRFPQIGSETLAQMSCDKAALLMDEKEIPTGWAALTPEALPACTASTPEELLTELKQKGIGGLTTPAPELNCRSARQILSSSKALLNHQVHDQVVSGSAIEPGLWIGSGCVIHPTVKLTPPVWIGENCRLEEGAEIGPNVSIADHCVLREHSTLKDCCVMQGTYIGAHLELDKTIVDRNFLAYEDAETAVAIPDRFLIAPNHPLGLSSLTSGLLGRTTAFLALLLTLPLTFVICLVRLLLYRRKPIERVECVQLPAPTDSMLWKTFYWHRWTPASDPKSKIFFSLPFMRMLPALPDIAFGRLHWAGLAPRTGDEVSALPEDWQHIYLGSKPGLFQLSEVDRRRIGDRSTEQQFSSEAFYAAARTIKLDFDILRQCILPSIRPPSQQGDTEILTLLTGEDTFDSFHAFLNEQLRQTTQDLSKDRINEIITALHEAFANIVKHAYDFAEGRPIQVHVNSQPSFIEFSLFDKGKSFDMDSITEPDFSGNTSGGFGWFIIKQSASHVLYSRNNKWNHLSLVFDRQTTGALKNEND
ncbi:ATP-binding protein [Pontiellaceae bacterium B12227]|nr:ATP-binding protein [Pontiellaceae bacterium B12227]